MNGTIAQAIGLTIAGNDFLRGNSLRDFWPSATIFKFCKAVSFVDVVGLSDPAKSKHFANDPLQWMLFLKEREVIGLRLHYAARNNPEGRDRTLSGFVGGGPRWFIEAVKKESSDIWEARWAVQNQNDPDRKIWAVEYGRLTSNDTLVGVKPQDLPTLKRELEGVLVDIEKFASREKLDFFAQLFSRAIKSLHAEHPLTDTYHPDLARSDQLSLDALKILAACQFAWVFGGMGSWNDLGFEGQAQTEYEQISERLFWLVNQALSDVANSSFRM